MKKLILLLIIVFGFATNLSAQNRTDVKRYEFEIGGGFLLGTDHAGYVGVGATGKYELRINQLESPLDVGVQLASHLYYSERYSDMRISYVPSLMGFLDYNYRPYRLLSFFCGAGAGAGIINRYEKLRGTFVISPRVGVELFNHLRITLDYTFLPGHYSFFGLSLGAVIGGGWDNK